MRPQKLRMCWSPSSGVDVMFSVCPRKPPTGSLKPNSTAFTSSRWIDVAVRGFGRASLPFRALLPGEDAPSRAPSGNRGAVPQQTAPLPAAMTFTPQPLSVSDNSRSQVFCYSWHKWTRAAGIWLLAPLFFNSYMGFSAVHFTHTHTHTLS